jgi:hypothetical protein
VTAGATAVVAGGVEEELGLVLLGERCIRSMQRHKRSMGNRRCGSSPKRAVTAVQSHRGDTLVKKMELR